MKKLFILSTHHNRILPTAQPYGERTGLCLCLRIRKSIRTPDATACTSLGSTDRNTWHSIGPERTFLRSEYASGRHGKRMLSPYLIKGNDGMWHCLWSVHEGYAVFAHCTSTDLISWGQQAFPTTGNTGNCMNPSVTFSPTGQDYLITWNSLQGENTKTYSCRTKDFRTYSIPQAENVAVPIDNRSQSTESQKAEPSTVWHGTKWKHSYKPTKWQSTKPSKMRNDWPSTRSFSKTPSH